jgi:hypothetical protein
MPPPLIRKETARLDQRSGLLPSNLPWPADVRGPAHPGGKRHVRHRFRSH